MEPITLETERLILDELRESDAQAMYEYCQDPDFERFLTIPWPYTLANARWFITEHAPVGWAEGSDLIWAIRNRDGQFLGVIGLRVKFGQHDVGFWLGRAHRGTGVMPEATNAVLDWAFNEASIDSVSWECMVGNVASMAVARKLGFTFTETSPSTLPARDLSHPPSWHGLLRATDDRTIKPGWPSAQNEGESAP